MDKKEKSINKIYKKKGVIILISILSTVMLTIFILFKLATWGGNTLIFKVSPSSNLINKVMSLRKTGGELVIYSEDINGVFDAALSNGSIPKVNNINIDTILCTLSPNSLDTYISANIRNINILLKCTGKLNYTNDSFKFTPTSFKLGKLKLPTDFIIRKISPMLQNTFTIDKGAILIPKDILPIDISSVEIRDAKIFASIEKLVIEESNQEDTDSNEELNTENEEESSASTDVNSNKTEKSTPTQEQKKQAQLRKTSSDLSKVYNALETSSGKSIISSIKSVLNKMIADPNYNYQPVASSVKSNYNSLSPEEKSDVKNAILFNMSMESLRSLNNTFHLI